MSVGPFRDSNASLLRRIAELERVNRRLEKRTKRRPFTDVGALLHALCRVVAMMLLVAGAAFIGFIGFTLIAAILLGIASIS